MPIGSTIAAIGAGIAAASSLASGIASIAGGGEEDKRPTLGGPDTFTGSTAKSLFDAFAQPKPPTAEEAGQQAIAGLNPLQRIQQRMNVIGSQLGVRQPALGGQPTATSAQPLPALPRLPGQTGTV